MADVIMITTKLPNIGIPIISNGTSSNDVIISSGIGVQSNNNGGNITLITGDPIITGLAGNITVTAGGILDLNANTDITVTAGGILDLNANTDITVTAGGIFDLALSKSLNINGVPGVLGQVMTSRGINMPPQWADVTYVGTVTSVGISGANGIGVTNTPITSSGVIALTLGAITPTSVAATGTVTGSNLSGTNTGDQTITLTGDVTGSGTGSFVTLLSTTGVVAGPYTNTSLTIDGAGRITAASNGPGFVTAPISSTSAGIPGQYAADAAFAYFCIDIDTWVRVPVVASF